MNDLERAFAAWLADRHNPEAVHDFWQCLWPRALEMARGYLGDRCQQGQTASDVLASVVQASGWLDHFRGSSVGELLLYLRTCIRHRMARLLSGREAISLGEFDPPAPDSSGAARAVELRERLDSILGTLPDEDRQLLHMRQNGSDYHDIAERFGISEAAARQRIRRVRASIRSRLEELA